jgi:hypothetical protein
MQCPGWCWDSGDGRTGPMTTEVTGPAGLTSRCSPVWARSSRLSPLRGLRRPLSWAQRVSRTGVGGTVSRDCRQHAAQRRAVVGMASPGELAE